MFEITHASVRVATAPSAASLTSAVQAAALPQADVGGWVSPRPRITRKGGVLDVLADPFGTHPQNQTTVTSIYEVPEGTGLVRTVAILSAVRDRLALAMRALDANGLQGYWSPVSVTRYAEAINGPVAWWSDGSAARTRTEERFPILTTDPDENPRGPTGADTHPTTPAETLDAMARRARQTAESGASLLWAGAALGLVAFLSYSAWKLGDHIPSRPPSAPGGSPA